MHNIGRMAIFLPAFYFFFTAPAWAVSINEIRIDQPGTDYDEYFELYGTAGASLDGLTYLVIGDGTGGSGVVEAAVDLSGCTIQAEGYFVAAETTFILGTADLTTSLNFENDDNVTHLLVSGFSGAIGDDLDSNDDGVLDFTPWTEELDRIALVKEENPPAGTEYHYGPPSVGPDGMYVPGQVFRCLNGWQIGQFDPAAGSDTPGGPNDCPCGAPATFIHEIQGNGTVSPETGNIHTMEGVVVGDYQNIGDTHLGGFFLQEEDNEHDGDISTSEGIFVYDGPSPTVDVHVGDLVRVTGTVQEYYDQTELNVTAAVSPPVICGSGSVSATTVNLPVAALDHWERYEGMLIHLPQPLYATDTSALGHYGEVHLSVADRLYEPTSRAAPGTEANSLQDLNNRSRILLDNGSSFVNPPIVPYLGAGNTLRLGDTMQSLTGVLSNLYDLYQVQPTTSVSFVRANNRESTPPDFGGELRIAGFNVYNYFTTLDESGPICGPAGGMYCRGADNVTEFVRQRQKIISTIILMDADIAGLAEIENHPDDNALRDLVNGLNDAAGRETYSSVATGPIGSDAIKVALIYKTDTVVPVGRHAILDSSVDPLFIDTRNRPSLAQTFMAKRSGEKFTVVVNHFKSKGSPCDDLGDPDMHDGQGNCNLTRTNAAIALVKWLKNDPTGSGDQDVLILGDLNSYALEDPITAIKNDGYVDLMEDKAGDNPYSYVYQGQAGYLDHALSSPGMLKRVAGAGWWHINSDEPAALDYNEYNQAYLYNPDPYRSSDHDPAVIELTFDFPWPMLLPAVINGQK